MALLLAGLSGCAEIGYYWQAASGHLSILRKKQSVEELLTHPDTPPALTEKLRLVREVQRFAHQELRLPERAGYTGYVDLQRPYVTVVVTAAQPLALKSYRWCYWFIGCQEYRGYFLEQDALDYARQIQQEQPLDVSIGYVSAYSTLGWLSGRFIPDYFSDPLLNTFLDQDNEEIIATLIHEIAHQVVYVPNDTPFNESFAVFVEQEGVRRFLDRHEGSGSITLQRYLEKRTDRELFRQLISSALEELKDAYAKASSDTERLQAKERILKQLKRTYASRREEFRVLSYERWFSRELNHAHLLGVSRYQNQVPIFARLFEEQGREWSPFYERVREIAQLPETERNRLLEILQ